VVRDLAEGNDSRDIDFLAYSRLADVQPISRSEVPRFYNAHPNARLFYQLKTFVLKRLDFIRREAVQDMRQGTTASEKMRGARDVMTLVALYTLMETSVDQTRDLIYGKELEELDDASFNNLLRIFAINRWQLDMVESGKVDDALISLASPASLRLLKDPGRDAADLIGKDTFNLWDMRTWGWVPALGDVYYWRMGGGDDRDLRQRRENLREAYREYYEVEPEERDPDRFEELERRRETFREMVKGHSEIKPFTEVSRNRLRKNTALEVFQELVE
jgi:hypothetical protein